MKEKLGVKVSDEKVKAAQAGGPNCPSCGSRLVTTSNVPKCPSCGTKPFERAHGEKEES